MLALSGPPRDEAPAGFSFEELYRESVADVHGYAISLLGDRASAEDVTALAFERLFRARSRLDRGGGRRGRCSSRSCATPPWTSFAAAPASPNSSRSPRRGGAGQDLDEQLTRIERRETVRAALGALTLREREIVLLKFHGQLTNAELGRVLSISESNAATRLHRALRSLREHCADTDREEVA